MKKIVAAVAILGMLGGIAVLSFPSSTNKPAKNPNSSTNVEDISRALFSFEDELADEEIRILDEASGDINADGKTDKAVILARSGGGSGVFIYVATYASAPVSYKGSNAVLLGDRVMPQSISISNGLVVVRYLDRNQDEPFSTTPTVEIEKEFIYKDGKLAEK